MAQYQKYILIWVEHTTDKRLMTELPLMTEKRQVNETRENTDMVLNAEKNAFQHL
jgi:hypothetical protein